MDSIEDIRISEESAQAGFGTEIDRPAAIFRPGIIGRVGIAKNASAEGHEAMVIFLPGCDC
jgi:hypothetical protein